MLGSDVGASGEPQWSEFILKLSNLKQVKYRRVQPRQLGAKLTETAFYFIAFSGFMMSCWIAKYFRLVTFLRLQSAVIFGDDLIKSSKLKRK